eukprot:gene15677-biopygen6281
MHRIEDVEGTEPDERPRRRGRWRRCGTLGAWGSAQASCHKAVALVEDGAVAEDAEYGQWRQGRLCKASEGVEEERKARKHWAPREVTEGSDWHAGQLDLAWRLPAASGPDCVPLRSLRKPF